MKLPAGYVISYAQNREDRIIEAFFPDVKKGFYVDIGANDPQDDSVTKLFYDKGWNGINVEPNPMLSEKLSQARRRDVNVTKGVSNKVGKINFREYVNHGLSTFSEEAKKENSDSKDLTLKQYKDYTVDVLPLSLILKKYAGKRNINFMKVDVEGYEYEALEGNDWKLYRPELLCIEANHVKHDWRLLLKVARYELVFDDGLNEYYLRAESAYRRNYFDYATAMILSGIIVNPGVAKRIVDLEEKNAENEKLKGLAIANTKMIRELNTELERYQSSRYLLQEFAKSILRKLKA